MSFDTLEQTKSLLSSSSSACEALYLQNLTSLGSLVAKSAQDESFRLSLVDLKVDTVLSEIIDDSFRTPESSLSNYYVRIFRGCLLLLRNLASTEIVNKSSSSSVIFSILGSLQRYSRLEKNHEFHCALLVSYFQALSNVSSSSGSPIIEEPRASEYISLVEQVGLPHVIDNSRELMHPFAVLLQNTFSQESEPLSVLLRETPDDSPNDIPDDSGSTSHLVDWTVRQFDLMDIDNQLGASDLALLAFAQQVVTHESYNSYLHRVFIKSRSDFTKSMEFNQIVVTSRDDWDNFQTTSILTWVFDFFKTFSKLAQEILPKKVYNEQDLLFIHANLIVLLDCLSDLGKFNSARQFLEHYDALAPLIELLRSVQDNIARKTLKKVETVDDTAKSFPQVKSLIIEIISYIAHESFVMQEKVREYHGLELVLSNCMIDENDPYIKERAIVCVKILLDKNPGNQSFVAQLEAKQTIDDQALREVGYEVEINNGKVELKKT